MAPGHRRHEEPGETMLNREPLTADDRLRVLRIAQALAPIDEPNFAALWPAMRAVTLAPRQALLAVGDAPPTECFVLEGILRSWIGDAQGRTVTLDFHTGPGVLTPAVARSKAGRSRIHCEALSAARVVVFAADALSAQMIAQPAMARWGDAVLTQELVRRMDRELALATQPARERLAALLAEQPGLPDVVAQHHLASYLGITPVSLSRLRAQARQRAD